MNNSSSRQDDQRLFAAKISLSIGLLVMTLKFIAVRLTSSQAILSDALESIVNVVAASMVVLTISYTAKPADKDHPYGHGKVEYFSAAFEGGLVSFAALLIIVESCSSLIYGSKLENIHQGLGIVFISGAINFALGYYLVQRGKSLQSLALKSSGYHVLSDVWTSVGLIVGLFLVHLTGWLWMDAVIALGFGFYLAFIGLGIVREAGGGLMDKEDPQVLNKITQAVKPHMQDGIIDIHEMKVIRSGRYHHIDMHLVLPEYWTVLQSHERTKAFEQAVINDYSFDGEMHFHYDPCRRDFCRRCNLKDCPIRQHDFMPDDVDAHAVRQSQSEEFLDGENTDLNGPQKP